MTLTAVKVSRAVFVLAAAVICVTSCSAVDAVTDRVQQSVKPDLKELTPSMLLPQSEFPQSDGKYEQGIQITEERDIRTVAVVNCVHDLLMLEIGDQQGFAFLKTPDATYKALLHLGKSRRHTQADLQSWANRCISTGRGGASVELNDLPPGSLSFKRDNGRYYLAGSSRGVLVVVELHIRNGVFQDVETDFVETFTRQVKRLEAS